MTFYWIIWGPRNGNPMGITLLKSSGLDYLGLRRVVKHFDCSIKCIELFDKALEMVEMEKDIHLISFCATRMGHFLTACDKAISLQCCYITLCIPVAHGRRRGISYLELKAFIYSSCS